MTLELRSWHKTQKMLKINRLGIVSSHHCALPRLTMCEGGGALSAYPFKWWVWERLLLDTWLDNWWS